MFLSTISLKRPSGTNRVLHIHLDTSDVPMQHLCIIASKYGGLYRTFRTYVILSFCRFSRHTSAKMKNGRQVVV